MTAERGEVTFEFEGAPVRAHAGDTVAMALWRDGVLDLRHSSRTVEFARSLMLDPSLVMLDEPSVGLDPKALRVIAGAIRQMSEAGKTLLIIEQNVRFGLRMSTHGVVMESGRVLMHDRADTVLNNPEMTDLFFGGTVTSAPRRATTPA